MSLLLLFQASATTTNQTVSVSCATATTGLRATAKSIAVSCATSTLAAAIKVFLATISIGCTTSVAAVRKSVLKSLAVTSTSAIAIGKAVAKIVAVASVTATAISALKSGGSVIFALSARVVTLLSSYARVTWPFKDPDEVLDYDVDWTDRLYSEAELLRVDAGETVVPADTIASSQFTLPSGSLVANSSTFSGVASKVWLTGGDEGVTYLIQNRITTAGGRTMDQTVKLKVKSK